MKQKAFVNSAEFRLAALILFSILCMTLIRYYKSLWIIGESFYAFNLIVTFFAPLAFNQFFLRYPWKELGFRWPKISLKGGVILLTLALLIPLVAYVILDHASFHKYYEDYRDSQIDASVRLREFTIFTLTTLTGWTVLHRSILLFGVKNILEKEMKERSRLPELIAVLFVCMSETIYHFLKPDREAWSMFLGSLILSAVALRTKSILIPFLAHLYIEAIFIGYMVLL